MKNLPNARLSGSRCRQTILFRSSALSLSLFVISLDVNHLWLCCVRDFVPQQPSFPLDPLCCCLVLLVVRTLQPTSTTGYNFVSLFLSEHKSVQLAF